MTSMTSTTSTTSTEWLDIATSLADAPSLPQRVEMSAHQAFAELLALGVSAQRCQRDIFAGDQTQARAAFASFCLWQEPGGWAPLGVGILALRHFAGARELSAALGLSPRFQSQEAGELSALASSEAPIVAEALLTDFWINLANGPKSGVDDILIQNYIASLMLSPSDTGALRDLIKSRLDIGEPALFPFAVALGQHKTELLMYPQRILFSDNYAQTRFDEAGETEINELLTHALASSRAGLRDSDARANSFLNELRKNMGSLATTEELWPQALDQARAQTSKKHLAPNSNGEFELHGVGPKTEALGWIANPMFMWEGLTRDAATPRAAAEARSWALDQLQGVSSALKGVDPQIAGSVSSFLEGILIKESVSETPKITQTTRLLSEAASTPRASRL